ncbi:MAG: alkaline phosphatase family protein [Ferruginibacter sp.]
MKLLLCSLCLLLLSIASPAQAPAQNVFIITIDGIRWQEIFKGADETLLRNIAFVQDTGIMLQQYGNPDPAVRRKRLLPFFWSVIAAQGQLYGNREFENKVNVANLYKISYPGYSEIFTGYADKLFIPNLAVRNPRSNVLQYLNNQQDFNGKVAAFCSWKVFPFILDEKNGQLPVNAGYEKTDGQTSYDTLFNSIQESVEDKTNTRHDLLTFECAKNYLQKQHPRVLYLGLGETDHFAHHGAYDQYLQKLHQADAIIAELWYYVQTDPFYKNNTSFIITTDHGRGNNSNWKTHGFWIKGSGETWLAMIGAGISATGEEKTQQQLYQKQLAATITSLLGLPFIAGHRVANPVTIQEEDIKRTMSAYLK